MILYGNTKLLEAGGNSATIAAGSPISNFDSGSVSFLATNNSDSVSHTITLCGGTHTTYGASSLGIKVDNNLATLVVAGVISSVALTAPSVYCTNLNLQGNINLGAHTIQGPTGVAAAFSTDGVAASSTWTFSGTTTFQRPVTIQSSMSVVGIATFSSALNARTFNSTSDARLKTNITAWTPSNDILALPLYSFNYKDSAESPASIGCLAQDLQQIAPELVHENDEGYLYIEEGKIVYLLLDAVRRLEERVKQLEVEHAVSN